MSKLVIFFLQSHMAVVGKFGIGQLGTEQFGIRTIWHQNSKNGQFGTAIFWDNFQRNQGA